MRIHSRLLALVGALALSMWSATVVVADTGANVRAPNVLGAEPAVGFYGLRTLATSHLKVVPFGKGTAIATVVGWLKAPHDDRGFNEVGVGSREQAVSNNARWSGIAGRKGIEKGDYPRVIARPVARWLHGPGRSDLWKEEIRAG